MHDKNGKLIEVGDKVIITGTVVETGSGDGTFCSVNVSVEGDWDGNGGTARNWFAAKQVEIVAKA